MLLPFTEATELVLTARGQTCTRNCEQVPSRLSSVIKETWNFHNIFLVLCFSRSAFKKTNNVINDALYRFRTHLQSSRVKKRPPSRTPPS